LFRFGFRQALKGAIIVGLISGVQLLVQGVAYQKAYSSAPKAAALARSLANAPGLGFIYGDAHNLLYSTQGYMVYRVLAFMGVVTSVWALMTTTKMLRGAEEDGRFELIRMSTTTPRRAASLLAAGFYGAWWVALLVSFALTELGVRSGNITTTGAAMWALNLGVFLPGLLFGSIGILTSQLGLTRGRAMLYGVVPLAGLFLVRGVANTDHGLRWLLNWTPFGWAQLISPVHNSDRAWILVLAVVAIAIGGTGVWLAQRDYGESIIRASTTVRSRFFLLKNAWSAALRQNFWTLLGWGIGALLVIGLIAGLANTAKGALKASGGLSKVVGKLGGANNLEVAFMSAGVLFMVMILLVMSTALIAQIRIDEARQYLDNILVAPQRRTTWLAQRLLLGLGVVLTISILGGLLLLAVASLQHITLNFGKVFTTSICLVGSVSFLLGLGALLYGFLPRLASIVMYTVIFWSFLITLLASAAHLSKWLLHSSVFYYTNFSLTQWPDWATFGWFMLLAIVFSTTGIWAFNHRDIISE
jgi:ABC-2 type transport system permease protein